MSNTLIIVLTAGAFVAALLVAYARYQRPEARARRAFAELVRMCKGDSAQARRMVDGEKRRAPGLSEELAARRAIRNWRRDLR